MAALLKSRRAPYRRRKSRSSATTSLLTLLEIVDILVPYRTKCSSSCRTTTPEQTKNIITWYQDTVDLYSTGKTVCRTSVLYDVITFEEKKGEVLVLVYTGSVRIP